MARLIPDRMDWSDIWRGEFLCCIDFRIYLHRMGKTASPYCLYEEGKVIDDAEHTVF